MRNVKNDMVIYAVVSLAAVAFIIAMDVTYNAYKQFYSFPKLAIMLYIITPIVVAILSYIKIMMQKRIPIRFSRIINSIAVVLLAIGVIAFYHPLSLFTLITRNLMTTFFFWLQLCALAYDLFFRREQEQE